LLPLVPSSIVVISESGVRSRDDVAPLFAAGARGFLVGESLMRAPNKAELVRALRGQTGKVHA
jgi:indole-3-glycerol phosphate synthase